MKAGGGGGGADFTPSHPCSFIVWYDVYCDILYNSISTSFRCCDLLILFALFKHNMHGIDFPSIQLLTSNYQITKAPFYKTLILIIKSIREELKSLIY